MSSYINDYEARFTPRILSWPSREDLAGLIDESKLVQCC